MQHLSALALLALGAPLASAQTPTALLREGDVLSNGNTVDDFRDPATSESGGFSITAIDVAQTGGNTSCLWGALDGGGPEILRCEAQLGDYLQTSYIGVALAPTEITYSGLNTNAVTGETNLFGLWLDDELIGIEGGPTGEPGRVWETLFVNGITNDGTPSFVGRSVLQVNGSDPRFGLYFGAGAPPILVGGETAPGLPAPIWNLGGFQSDFSSHGTHSIVGARMDLPPLNDSVLLLDGVGLELGGTLVRQGTAVPASIGGLSGEEWLLFAEVGINEAGDHHFTSRGAQAINVTDLLVANGEVLARAGDVVDGFVLRGYASVAMNEKGDLAHCWSGDDSTPGILVLNGDVVLREGDGVDWDGDGAPDMGVTLHDLPSPTPLAISPDRTLYFVAEIDVNGTILKAFLRVDFGLGQSYCTATANSTGQPATLSAAGSVEATDNDLSLFAQQLPLNRFGYFLNSQTQDFVIGAGGSQGNLCLGGAIGRYGSQVFSTGATGTGLLTLDLPNTPTPMGVTAVLAGQTWNFQAWYRDNNPAPTSNFTDAISVDFL